MDRTSPKPQDILRSTSAARFNMRKDVSCYEFHCPKCHGPIMLPLDALERQFPDREDRPNDDFPLALVCVPCKRVDIYSPQQSSPYFDHEMLSKEWSPSGETALGAMLLCGGKGCQFRVALLETWTRGTTLQEKIDARTIWERKHLRCPYGHPIHWPWL